MKNLFSLLRRFQLLPRRVFPGKRNPSGEDRVFNKTQSNLFDKMYLNFLHHIYDFILKINSFFLKRRCKEEKDLTPQSLPEVDKSQSGNIYPKVTEGDFSVKKDPFLTLSEHYRVYVEFPLLPHSHYPPLRLERGKFNVYPHYPRNLPNFTISIGENMRPLPKGMAKLLDVCKNSVQHI